MKKIVIFLLLIASGVFAAYESFDVLSKTYFPLAGITIFTCALLAGIVYMFGNLLMNEKIKVWAKGEVVEIVYSAIIFFVIVGFVYTGDEIMKSFTKEISPFSAGIICTSDIQAFNTFKSSHGESIDSGYENLPCHLRIAKNFLASIFYETAGFVKRVGITNSWYIYFSSFSIDFMQSGTTSSFSGSSFSHSIFGFLNAKSNALSFLFDNGIKVLTLVRFQEILINFIGLAIFPVMLTAGVILRVFAITRKLGGLLMALALSLYFIFPIFYIFGDSVYNEIKLGQMQQGQNNLMLPLNEQPVLAFLNNPNMKGMPKMLNGDEVGKNENYDVNTISNEIGTQFLNQLNFISADKKCEDVIKEEQENRDKQLSLPDILRKLTGLHIFGENSLLATWLNDAYNKGGVWGSHINVSFNSIIIGIDVLAKAMFFSLFFSFLSIFATIAAVKSLSPMLGGDVEIAGLTHLI